MRAKKINTVLLRKKFSTTCYLRFFGAPQITKLPLVEMRLEQFGAPYHFLPY